ncbi:acyl carrier protein [Solihabitans fulvus]|uniref:Acyl carrier protein n=1 Tax=Solihabitans fulvus TaxID=1892852 RepID=A0A5B2X318_9PSEU|nr:acyl carrier protein [Solihabitans fulvus]KAA2257575.1 acyl carrier protein [Solihabitans fulvus]
MTTPKQDTAATDTAATDPDAIRDWLLDRVAFYLERPVTDLRPDVKLVEYGLDSVYALTLCGDIEDEYGLELEPTLAWDHPTVDAIVTLLREMISGNR